jgi:quaternary ammonium compound-resistance protein SugE
LNNSYFLSFVNFTYSFVELCRIKFKIMNWIYLILGGLFEVAFTFCMGKAKEANITESYWWYSGFLSCLIASMFLLIKATKTLPIGTAYVVWTGIGAVGTVLMGIFVFKEPATFWRLFFIVTLIGSTIGLKSVSQ